VGKKLRVAHYIIAIAIGVAFAILPFVLEGMGVKVPLFIWWFLEILAILTIVSVITWLNWQRIQNTCRRLCVMFQAYRQIARRMLETGKLAHIGHKDINSLFKLRERTVDDLQVEIEYLKKQVEESKRDKLGNSQSENKKECS